MIHVSGDLQTGAGYILHSQTDLFIVRRGEDHLQIIFFHQGFQAHAVSIHHNSSPLLCLCRYYIGKEREYQPEIEKSQKICKKVLAFFGILWYHI